MQSARVVNLAMNVDSRDRCQSFERNELKSHLETVVVHDAGDCSVIDRQPFSMELMRNAFDSGSAGIPHTATIRSHGAFSRAAARRDLLGNSAQVVWRRLFDMEMNPAASTGPRARSIDQAPGFT